jgi:CBS domain-containing protein
MTTSISARAADDHALPPTLVGELMSAPVLTVELGESLWDAWQLLFVSGLRHLVVINDEGGTVGVISDRALLSDLPFTPEHMSRRLVGDVLARVPVASIGPDATPGEAARVMRTHATEALPVIDANERLVGIISSTDLVRWLGSP